MSRPFMEKIKQYTESITAFSGIDKRARIPEGKFSDMANMSSGKYPLLSTRPKRHTLDLDIEPTASGEEVSGNITGMISKEKMCYAKGTGIVIGRKWIDMGLQSPNHSLVSFGSYIIILPEKKYINYADTEDRGDIEAVYTVSTDKFGVGLSDESGNGFSNVTSSDTAPVDPANGDYWVDTSGLSEVLKQYSEYSMSWVSVAASYIRLSRTGIAEKFKAGDSITISGIPKQSEYSFLNGSHVITSVDEKSGQHIVIPGIPSKRGDYIANPDEPVYFKRTMPTMDFVIESGNRLWGCRYGEVDGKRVNEIYASKLGDFKNWNVFEGVSTDSYAASVGTDGRFTGAVSFRGYPYFFKEKTLHKIYGSYPSQYQIQTTDIEGVCNRCGNSIAVVDNVLFYKSRNGVCMYDGSYPTDIGAPLGGKTYHGVIAGAADGKYYIYLGMGNGLWCYDTSTGIWSREGSPDITHMEEHGGILHFTDGTNVHTINGVVEGETNRATAESDFEWFAETGDMGIDIDSKKYISRLLIRTRLPITSRMRVMISYDSSGAWETLYDTPVGSLRVSNINVRPKRCDHFRLRIEGRGECEIYSITKYLEIGSIY